MHVIIFFIVLIYLIDFFRKNILKDKVINPKYSYSQYLVSIIAKIAKSDGFISRKEADFIGIMLDDIILSHGGRRADLISIFNIEKDNSNNIIELSNSFARDYFLSMEKKIDLVYFLLNLVYVDGLMNFKERMVLNQICRGFNIPYNIQVSIFKDFRNKYEYRNERESRSAHSKSNYDSYNNGYSDNPYNILGVDKNASFDEIKNAYRQLVKKYHPDILMGRGLNSDMIQEGTKKLQQINMAYEKIKKDFDKNQ